MLISGLAPRFSYLKEETRTAGEPRRGTGVRMSAAVIILHRSLSYSPLNNNMTISTTLLLPEIAEMQKRQPIYDSRSSKHGSKREHDPSTV